MYKHEILQLNKQVEGKINRFLNEKWGSTIIVSKGRIHRLENLSGYFVMENEEIVGLITYFIENAECEIVTLDSLIENMGIGSRLIENVNVAAKKNNCERVWLITTNDNVKAIRFYQKRGFNIKAVHVDAIENSRKIKPEIPLLGCDGIPIRHEIEFEKLLI